MTANDLISREALLHEFKRKVKLDRNGRGSANVTRKLIEGMPTIDAKATRYGTWEFRIPFNDESARDNFDIVCSACKALFKADNEETAWKVREWPYCPWCGATMNAGI